MTEAEAETIVNAFADILAEGVFVVSDSSLLPYPKAVIDQALVIQIRAYASLWDIDPAIYVKSGGAKHVESLGAVRAYLEYFVDIDSDDKPAVARLKNWCKERGPLPDEASDLITKYGRRRRTLTSL